MSKAIDLRNGALRLAARDGSELVLTEPSELASAVTASIGDAIADARSIVLVGLSTPGFLISCFSSLQGRQLAVAESDPARLTAPEFSPPNLAGQRLRVSADPLDLRIDPAVSDELVADMKPVDYRGYKALADRIAQRAALAPLIADESADLIVIDCMTNRLCAKEAARMHAEAFRVLRRGGRAIEIALLADDAMPEGVAIESGPWRGVRFPVEGQAADELAAAGFHGMSYEPVLPRPVQMSAGVEIRAFILRAFKGKQGVCRDQGHAVIYRGPWSAVHDDDGHRYVRGERAAVCAKTYELLAREPYRGEFIGLPACAPVPLARAPLFDCNTPAIRSPAVTKGLRSVLEAQTPVTKDAGCCSQEKDTHRGQDCC
jgi:arsenite methyltransferase